MAEAAECGVDFIQLREKDLSTHELELLARDAMSSPLTPIDAALLPGIGHGRNV